jgi:hydroxymethylglutaryl-CoA reductase (NADPH)
MSGGLKNRGKTKQDVEERRQAAEEFTGAKLSAVSHCSFDPIMAEKNIENMIGCVQIPLGFVGPILINGPHGHDGRGAAGVRFPWL